MIRNVVFDMGNVLIRFDPARFVERLGLDSPEDRELLLREIFRSAEWPMLDWGALDEAGFEALVLPRIPERLHDAARTLIYHWDEPIEPIPGMEALARACKEAGLGVYLLSNASARLYDYWKRVPGSAYFDGMMVSAPLRCIKPMPEIYRRLLDQFNLRAEECLFLDDSALNVCGAKLAGMNAVIFDGDVNAARAAIFGQAADH